jgi:hypothetical protein
MVVIDAIRPSSQRSRRGKGISVKKCSYAVLGCICCIFLLPAIFLGAPSPVQWQTMELASLSQLRHTTMTTSYQDTVRSEGTPDGHFNGFPVYLRVDQSSSYTEDQDAATTTPHSRVHCVGDNYREDAWLQRSCVFSMLCYDLVERDFVIFQSHQEEVLNRFLHARPAMQASSTIYLKPNETTGVALGGINKKWNLAIDKKPSSKGFKWFPRVLNATPGMMTHYALPSNTVMIPYHSLAAKNPGHLVWDDFLPIYTLLTMFQLQNQVLLPLRVLFSDIKLWSSCEASGENERMCKNMIHKFASLLVGQDYPYNLTTSADAHFVPVSSKQERQSNYVCAPRGAAGLGPLTDHGTKKLHGWIRDDYKITHNHGRGALLYEFRNFMLENLGLPITPIRPSPPFKVVFSVASSDIKTRDMDFAKQIDTLKQNFPPEVLSVKSYVMKDLSVYDQVKVASEASIFITICGGGAVTGMFLPKGATVILYYLEHGGVEYGVPTHAAAYLDWDLFNNLSHLRTHWLPTQTMDQRVDCRALVLLVQQELELLQSEVLL